MSVNGLHGRVFGLQGFVNGGQCFVFSEHGFVFGKHGGVHSLKKHRVMTRDSAIFLVGGADVIIVAHSANCGYDPTKI